MNPKDTRSFDPSCSMCREMAGSRPMAIEADKAGKKYLDRVMEEYGYDSMTFAEARGLWWAMRNKLGF